MLGGIFVSDSQPDDHERFVAHFVRHQSSIYSFISTIVPNSMDVDEIMQDASLVMWKKFSQYSEGTNFRNWAFQVAKFTAMNHIRKVKRDRHVFTTQLVELLASDMETHGTELEARRSAFRLCVTKLKENDRDLLAGCYSENQSIKQFASRLDRTPNSVYKQLNRIRRDLLTCIRSVHGNLSPTS